MVRVDCLHACFELARSPSQNRYSFHVSQQASEPIPRADIFNSGGSRIIFYMLEPALLASQVRAVKREKGKRPEGLREKGLPYSRHNQCFFALHGVVRVFLLRVVSEL